VTQTEPLHEVVCPSCDATIRARMADAPERSLMTTTDGDPITAAISYATLALLQLTRPDSADVLDGPRTTGRRTGRGSRPRPRR